MKLSQLAQLGANHVRNALGEEFYLRTGRDFTAPIAIYGAVNEICNYKCRYCEFWRLPNYRTEMSIADWQKALLDLKAFVGAYHIEFSGGEPYLKKGFMDLISFCDENGIKWGVTTNGSAFNNDKVVHRTVSARPFNINLSIDSKQAEIHDYSRGIKSSLGKIVSGIAKVIEERRRQGQNFPIIIKTVVHRLNFRLLPEMSAWVREIGATAINFQPVDRCTPETHDELWIEECDMEELAQVCETLTEQKRAGASILNSEVLLRMWPEHFREKQAPPEVRPCRVGMRNYLIRPDGNVEVCWFYPPIGNVRTHTAREIWYGEEGSARRAETVACDRLCLFTCLSQKSLKDKVQMGLKLLTGASERS